MTTFSLFYNILAMITKKRENVMKVLHTSDWHLGQNFMGHSRKEEHKAFLKWLLERIKEQNITLLIVAGDIFDTGTPPNYALELYYTFLSELYQTSCKDVIVIGGNHDAIATLKAPKTILDVLGVHVVAGLENEEVVFPIYNANNELEAVVCAVAFLRDGMIRKSIASLGVSDVKNALEDGIRRYYKGVFEKAKEIAKDTDIPILATGHLSVSGLQSSDSEREIYVGNLLQLDGSYFESMFDYTALGHLHKNQSVSERVRYSGSVIPLSFSEASQEKFVNIVEFKKRTPKIQKLQIPRFKNLYRFQGDKTEIVKSLEAVEQKGGFVEITLHEENPYGVFEEILEIAKKKSLEILVQKTVFQDKKQTKQTKTLNLESLSVEDVFVKKLESEVENKELKSELLELFRAIHNEVIAENKV